MSMDKWEMTSMQVDEWKCYHLDLDGVFKADARWRVLDGVAYMHNTMTGGSISLLKKARSIFHDVILPEIREAGCDHVTVVQRNKQVDTLLLHYWKFMGFTVIEDEARGFYYGVMEV